MSIGVKIIKQLPLMEKSGKITSTVRKCITDYTDDLYTVSASRTPVDEGNLESSGSKQVSSGKNITGTVSFLATHRGYNYAVKMHDSKYKLGAKSRRKRPMRSKYSSKAFSVGSKYLLGTALSCEKGYTKDLNEKLNKVID